MTQPLSHKISDAELAIMKVLWQQTGPMTYMEIYDAMTGEKAWAKNTVKTLIGRLVEKGVVEKQPGEVFRYAPLLDRETFLRDKNRSFLNQMYDGSVKGLVSALIQQDFLSDQELAELEDFWRKGKKRNGNDEYHP